MPRPGPIALNSARDALRAAGVSAIEKFAPVVATVARDDRPALAELLAHFERWQRMSARERLGLLLTRCLNEPTPRLED